MKEKEDKKLTLGQLLVMRIKENIKKGKDKKNEENNSKSGK